MFASCAIVSGTTTPFLSGKRLSYTGTSGSCSSSGRMSFTGTNNPNFPSWSTIEAFAESSTNTKSRRRIEEMKPIPKTANLYEVLRVNETASQVEIKTAYRNLAKLYHPDAATSDSDARDFIEIHNAYSMLSDPTARARYDLSIASRMRFSSSSSSSSSTAPGFVMGRSRNRTSRWETDQCW